MSYEVFFEDESIGTAETLSGAGELCAAYAAETGFLVDDDPVYAWTEQFTVRRVIYDLLSRRDDLLAWKSFRDNWVERR
jgi:hypothetical protein